MNNRTETVIGIFNLAVLAGVITWICFSPEERASHPDPSIDTDSISFQAPSTTEQYLILESNNNSAILERVQCLPDEDQTVYHFFAPFCNGRSIGGVVTVSGELLGGGRERDFTLDHEDDAIDLICVEKDTIREVSRHNGG